MSEPNWSLILHGGCKPISPDKAEAHRAGCLRALEAGLSLLRAGASAVEAVEACVLRLEDDPTFNAGTGSALNADGEVEMDAAIMCGEDLRLGAVGALRAVRNPVAVARALLSKTTAFVVGEGALRFARERGFAELTTSPHRRPAATDTVGCVARDHRGHLAAATSTGGLDGKRPGRVGDSPMPGCGVYADDQAGGVSLSGEGDAIARAMIGARVVLALERGEPVQRTVERALRTMDRVGGAAGIIAIDREGQIGWAHNKDQFAVAWSHSVDTTPQVALSRQEVLTHV